MHRDQRCSCSHSCITVTPASVLDGGNRAIACTALPWLLILHLQLAQQQDRLSVVVSRGLLHPVLDVAPQNLGMGITHGLRTELCGSGSSSLSWTDTGFDKGCVDRCAFAWPCACKHSGMLIWLRRGSALRYVYRGWVSEPGQLSERPGGAIPPGRQHWADD